MHSFKLAATLQHVAGGNPHPLLLRLELKAGHGAGKPTEFKLVFRCSLNSRCLMLILFEGSRRQRINGALPPRLWGWSGAQVLREEKNREIYKTIW
jgi:hypothetical protein